MKEDVNTNCPKSVSQTYEDTAGFKANSKFLYAVDRDRIRHMYPKGTQEYKQFETAERKRLIKEGKYYDPDQVADIYFHGCLEEKRLSNFYETSFAFEGVQINSMEGFIQSLKTPDVKLQRHICTLVGKEAWQAGHLIEGFDGVHLYWAGCCLNRFSGEYLSLLERVYETKYEHDSLFRNMLKRTAHKKLIHTIGKTDPKETVLTADEFVGLLNNLRKKHGIC